MKKLLIVTEALEMNGVLRSLLDFMTAMDKSQYEISLFCFDAHRPFFVQLPEYVTVLPESPGCYMARAPFSQIFRWAMRHGAYVSLFKRVAVSLLQTKFSSFSKTDLAIKVPNLEGEYDVACAYSMGMTWRFVAEKVTAEKKLFWLDTDVRFSPWSRLWMQYAPYLRTGRLVCISEAIRGLMAAEFPEKVGYPAVVHNVVDTKAICEKGSAPLDYPHNGKFRIVTVGRYCPAKNQVMIPQIAAALRERGEVDFEWIMVGPGAASYKTNDPNLVYLDSIPNPMPLMKSADLYVQPSTYEGWGLTLSEAMCLGRYVIASDILAFREQIRDDRVGRLVPISPVAFADAIVDCWRSHGALSCPLRAKEMASRFCYDAVRKEFDYALS